MKPGIARACTAAVFLMAALPGCGAGKPEPVTRTWYVARSRPPADVTAPPDVVRESLERLLSRGLVDEDSLGAIVPRGAERFDVSGDSLTYTFHIRAGLTYVDGTPCRSADFRDAILDGLAHEDHATKRWLLRAVEGVPRVRPGRELPPIGIDIPDESTLVVRLRVPDTRLLHALARPGMSAPWRPADASGGWLGRTGTGPYRVVDETRRGGLTFAMAQPGGPFVGPDTLRVRFISGARTGAALRSGAPDLFWPAPLGEEIRNEAIPGYAWEFRRARPDRRLLLVMRPDRRPTSRPAARWALAHSLNRTEVLRDLGPAGERANAWWEGAGVFDFPKLDAREVLGWLARGRLGRSFQSTLAFDPDEVSDAVAGRMQANWARSDLAVDLRPARGSAWLEQRLSGRAQLLLLVQHAPIDDPAADLAILAMPERRAPVGAFRTGWRTRVFDAWTGEDGPVRALDPGAAQAQLESELVALPIARLNWSWALRDGVKGVSFHPRFGPEFARAVTQPSGKR